MNDNDPETASVVMTPPDLKALFRLREYADQSLGEDNGVTIS
jgi:hypothetical protein